jgi:hypothetical protein
MRRKNREQPIQLNDEQKEVYMSVELFCLNNYLNIRRQELDKEAIKQMLEGLDKVGWIRVKGYIVNELTRPWGSVRFLEPKVIRELVKLDVADPNFGESRMISVIPSIN